MNRQINGESVNDLVVSEAKVWLVTAAFCIDEAAQSIKLICIRNTKHCHYALILPVR